MADFVPDGDGSFESWAGNLLDYLNANLAAFGLVAADTADAGAKRTTFETDNAAVEPAENNYRSKVDAKNISRQAYEAALRALARKIHGNASVSDADKTAAGLPVHDPIRTPVPAPTSSPVGTIDTSQRLQHKFHFRDQNTPTSRAKPPGVRGCEIYVKIGNPAPANIAEMNYETTDTRTPHTIEFDPGDAGKMVHYWFRWVSTRNEPGPWGAPVSATVVG